MIKQKKPNKDALKHKKVMDQNSKDHDGLVVIANQPVLGEGDIAKYNAIVKKENQKPHLPKKTKKIMDQVYSSVDQETQKQLEKRIDPRVQWTYLQAFENVSPVNIIKVVVKSSLSRHLKM